jgi:thiol-disulfide isomerase/thioredoxin
MKPVVDGLAKKYTGRYTIKVMNASTGGAEVEQLEEKLGIQYVPTFVFVDSDGTKIATIVGEATAAALEAELAKLK